MVSLQTATVIASILVGISFVFVFAALWIWYKARKHLRQVYEDSQQVARKEHLQQEDLKAFFRKTLSGEEGYHVGLFTRLDS